MSSSVVRSTIIGADKISKSMQYMVSSVVVHIDKHGDDTDVRSKIVSLLNGLDVFTAEMRSYLNSEIQEEDVEEEIDRRKRWSKTTQKSTERLGRKTQRKAKRPPVDDSSDSD